jgi:hypothetical protein
MTSLERTLIEIGATILFIAGFVAWWQFHDHTEQNIGAQKCIISTTEVKSEVVADNSKIESAHAAQMTQVVKTYDAQVASLSAGNAALARSLHDNAVRQSAAPRPRPAACEVRAVDLPAGQSDPVITRGALIDRAEVKVFDDCDADHSALIGVTAAYNDVRRQMLEANQGR